MKDDTKNSQIIHGKYAAVYWKSCEICDILEHKHVSNVFLREKLAIIRKDFKMEWGKRYARRNQERK